MRLQIGGLGGTVSIANGIGVSGTIQAKSFDQGRDRGPARRRARPRRSCATRARSWPAADHTAGSIATAVEIGVGASLPILRNSGEIKASAGGADGTAVAIVDKSGTLILIENSGAISATGAAAASNRNVAIDLSANTTGATIKQTVGGGQFPGTIDHRRHPVRHRQRHARHRRRQADRQRQLRRRQQ